MCQSCRNQGEGGGTGGPLQIFGRADLLPADNDSEKKKIAKKKYKPVQIPRKLLAALLLSTLYNV